MYEITSNLIEVKLREGERKENKFETSLEKITRKTNAPMKVHSSRKQDKVKNELYSVRFSKKNIPKQAKIPFTFGKVVDIYDGNENVKYRKGETERLLNYEYYVSSYKNAFKNNSPFNTSNEVLKMKRIKLNGF